MIQPGILRLYRQLQILAVLSNSILQTSTLAFTMVALLIMSVSGTVVVKLDWSIRNAVALSFFARSGMECVNAFLVIFGGGMVPIHLMSREIFVKLRSRFANRSGFACANRVERKWFELFCQSCPPLRVRIGESNYVEALTPLRCLECGIQLTVHMLLIVP